MSVDLYRRFNERNVVEKLIIVNILVFILTYLLNTASFLFNYDGNMLVDWFALKPSFGQLLYRPWTLISYGFLHVGFFHILFNLLILYNRFEALICIVGDRTGIDHIDIGFFTEIHSLETVILKTPGNC